MFPFFCTLETAGLLDLSVSGYMSLQATVTNQITPHVHPFFLGPFWLITFVSGLGFLWVGGICRGQGSQDPLEMSWSSLFGEISRSTACFLLSDPVETWKLLNISSSLSWAAWFHTITGVSSVTFHPQDVILNLDRKYMHVVSAVA